MVPGDRLLDADLEAGDGVPVKLHVGFAGVDRVALVMPMPVGDVGDEGFGLTQFPQDDLHDVDVGLFVMPSEVIYLADPSFLEDRQYAAAVVLDIEPVPDIESLPVYGVGAVVIA